MRNVTWSEYRQSIGDRSSLFAAVRAQWNPQKSLYLGSYVDLSPSTALADVTYVDMDRRAQRFFADESLVAAELAGRTQEVPAPVVTFVSGDFNSPLDLEEHSYDLVISLFSGPSVDAAKRYLAPGGLLLTNASHGDASLAALDDDFSVVAAVLARGGAYRLDTKELHRYLVPKNPDHANVERILTQGRGIAYTRPAFAYIFRSA